MLVTFSEFAAIKGCAKGTVTAATKTRIAAAVVEKDGKRWLDRDLALELWNRNTKATHNAKVSQADPIEEPAPRDARELRARLEALPDDAIPELNESRARREHYQAELSKLQEERSSLMATVEQRAGAGWGGEEAGVPDRTQRARGAGESGRSAEPPAGR